MSELKEFYKKLFMLSRINTIISPLDFYHLFKLKKIQKEPVIKGHNYPLVTDSSKYNRYFIIYIISYS
jgi:hypothetical protein